MIAKGDIFYVYLYWLPEGAPGSHEPLYCGKGHGRRAYRHLFLAQKSQVRWHRELRCLLAFGYAPEIYFAAEGLSEAEAFQLERELILRYGRRDLGTGCLWNETDGGEGETGLICSEETRKKISEAKRAASPASVRHRRAAIAAYWTSERREEQSRRQQRHSHNDFEARAIVAIRWDGSLLRFKSIKEALRAYYSPCAVRRAITNHTVYKGATWSYS